MRANELLLTAEPKCLSITRELLHTPFYSLPIAGSLTLTLFASTSSGETMQVARIEAGPKNERYEELCYRHSAKRRCAPYGVLSFWDGEEARYRLAVSDDERWSITVVAAVSGAE